MAMQIQEALYQLVLQECEHKLMRDPESTAELIPQLIWAIITHA